MHRHKTPSPPVPNERTNLVKASLRPPQILFAGKENYTTPPGFNKTPLEITDTVRRAYFGKLRSGASTLPRRDSGGPILLIAECAISLDLIEKTARRKRMDFCSLNVAGPERAYQINFKQNRVRQSSAVLFLVDLRRTNLTVNELFANTSREIYLEAPTLAILTNNGEVLGGTHVGRGMCWQMNRQVDPNLFLNGLQAFSDLWTRVLPQNEKGLADKR